jgi:hypothetical protein
MGRGHERSFQPPSLLCTLSMVQGETKVEFWTLRLILRIDLAASKKRVEGKIFSALSFMCTIIAARVQLLLL